MVKFRGESWTEKYRPRSLSEVVGNPSAVRELREWAESFPKHRAVILYGPPGCGKTSAALALASERGWDVVELNASDKRSADVIKHIVGHAAESEAFSKSKTRLIILDEADNIHGTEDRGGVKAITEIVKRSEQPIVLIANEIHKISGTLKRYCKLIRFRRLNESAVIRVLRKICVSERLNVSDDVLREIAKNAKGDLRSAINDLQALASLYSAEERVMPEDIAAISERDREETIFSVMSRIFHGCDAEFAFVSLVNLDMTPEDIERWIYENITTSISDALGMRCLCLADKFIGRTRKTENFRLWKYASSMMACIAEVAAEKRSQGRTRTHSLRPPSFLKKSEFEEELASKISKSAHIPVKSARHLIPLLKVIFEKNVQHAAEIASHLDLNDEEILFLTGGNDEMKAHILIKMREIETKKSFDTMKTEEDTKKDEVKKGERKSKIEKAVDKEAGEVTVEIADEKKREEEERGKQRTLAEFI